jgi:hypothetical protein
MSDTSPTADDLSATTEIQPGTEHVETPNTGDNTPDRPAESSTAKTAASMLETVNAALKPKEGSPSSETPGKAEAKPQDSTKPETPDDELSDDELSKVGEKVQRRFKRYASDLRGKDAEIAGLKPKADEFDRIVTSVKTAGLDNREVDALISLGSDLRRNPSQALERLMPIVAALQEQVGVVLSPELQEQVRLGYLTEEHARRISKAEATGRITSQQAEREAAERKAKDEAEAQTKAITASIDAVEKWDKAKAEKDPDWHLKRNEVAEQVELAIGKEARKRNAPYYPTPEEAVKLAEDALKTVQDRYKRFTPKPKDVRPTSVDTGASSRSKPQPKSMLDVVNNVLGG